MTQTKHAETAELLGSEEIIHKKKPVETLCGVYFLINNDEIVYVGQSVNIWSRLSQHKKDKEFSHFHWIPVQNSYLEIVENDYIIKFNPIYNKAFSRKLAGLISTNHLTQKLRMPRRDVDRKLVGVDVAFNFNGERFYNKDIKVNFSANELQTGRLEMYDAKRKSIIELISGGELTAESLDNLDYKYRSVLKKLSEEAE